MWIRDPIHERFNIAHLETLLKSAFLTICPADSIHHAGISLPGAVAVLLAVTDTAPEKSPEMNEYEYEDKE